MHSPALEIINLRRAVHKDLAGPPGGVHVHANFHHTILGLPTDFLAYVLPARIGPIILKYWDESITVLK